MKDLNNLKSSRKFTCASDRHSTNFLDLNVKLDNSELTTSVYKIPTDFHQYLHYSSSLLDHIKQSVVYSQTLQASRLCSFNEDFVDYSEKIKTLFSKQVYPDKITENAIKKVNFGDSRSKTKCATGLHFVVTYLLRLKALGKTIHEKLNLLYMNQEVKDTFTPGPMVSVRAAQKLNSYLVRATYTH